MTYLWSSLQFIQTQLPGLTEGLNPIGLNGLGHAATQKTETTHHHTAEAFYVTEEEAEAPASSCGLTSETVGG